MKNLIIILLLLASLSNQAQTLSTAKLSDSMRAHRNLLIAQANVQSAQAKTIAAILAKLDVKDANDDNRNFQIRVLNARQDSLKKSVDKMTFTLYRGDFFIDSVNNTLYLSRKDDTVIIKRMKYPSVINALYGSSESGIISEDYVSKLKLKIKELETVVSNDAKIKTKLRKELKKEKAKNKK